MFAARCWYDIGNWEFASRGGVHRYAAMAGRGEENLAAAVEFMAQAVDEEFGSMEENIRLLRPYQAEEQEKGGLLPSVHPK